MSDFYLLLANAALLFRSKTFIFFTFFQFLLSLHLILCCCFTAEHVFFFISFVLWCRIQTRFYFSHCMHSTATNRVTKGTLKWISFIVWLALTDYINLRFLLYVLDIALRTCVATSIMQFSPDRAVVKIFDTTISLFIDFKITAKLSASKPFLVKLSKLNVLNWKRKQIMNHR